jgi:hypothetical protein
MATLRYVGVLKEILVVSYATIKRILFRASWTPSNLRGVQTIRQDHMDFGLLIMQGGYQRIHNHMFSHQQCFR